MRKLLSAVVCLAAVSVAGCRSRGEAPALGGRCELDPQALWVDARSPFVTFDGQVGSMLPGPGWAPPEGDDGRGDWGTFAWASADEVTLWFSQSFDEPLDLYLRCAPYPFDAVDPPQELTLVAEGEEVARVELEPGWQEVRLPLPRPRRPLGLHEIRLRFSRTTRPVDLGASQDARTLAAAVSLAAVVPREVAEPASFLKAHDLNPEECRIDLPVGGAFSVPLPASRRGAFRIGEVEEDCPDCILEIDLVGQDGRATRLREGGVADLAREPVSFDTTGRGISRLVARVRDTSPGSFWRAPRVAFSMPEDFVHLEPAEAGSAAPSPHVFLYLVDTLRADALAAYGGEPALTPNMTAFGDRAVVYENARAASSWTLPSVVSILTGVYPFRHHVMKGDVMLDSDELPGLGRLLADQGYETVGISQSFVASADFGIDGEFEYFFLNNQLNARKLRSQSIRKALVHWLTAPEREQDVPVFAYLHSVDPHAPYSPPPEYRALAEETPGTLAPDQYRPSVFMTDRSLASMPGEVEHMKALYLGEVAYTDGRFGRFLDLLRRLDLYDSSLIILTSDHGEEFGEHGGFDHGRTLYDELLKVPLIVKFPQDRWGGTRVARPVSTVDILPTVLSLTGGAEVAKSRHGTSLVPDATGPDAGRRGIFAEVSPVAAPHASAVDLRALVVSGSKCIQNLAGSDQFGRPAPEWSVYDLTADPGEQHALDPASTEARRCREALLRWLAARQAERDAPAAPAATSEQTQDQLRALGYIK